MKERMTPPESQVARQAPIDPEEIVCVRRGPGANCSSIGSVLDVIFLSAVVGGAILVGVAAALGGAPAAPPPDEAEDDDARAG